MSTTKSFAGASYALPANREPKGWGTAVSNFLIAVADNAIPKTGGSYPLSAELNLGSSYGLLAPYLKSAAANIASAGVLRLAKTDVVAWRNNANGADVSLGLSASDRVQVGSAAVLLATDTIAAHASTTSAQLASVISDETGSGSLVFATSPTLVTPNLGTPSAATLTNATGLPLTSGVTGTLPLGNGGTGQTTAAAAFKALAAYAAKGDLVGYDGSARGILTVGSDGTVLTADSASTYGIKWATALSNPMTTAADIIVGGVSGAATRLAKGTANQVLGMNSGATAQEYKSLAVGTSGTDFAVAHSANTVTLNLPDASTANRGAVTTAAQTIGGAKTFNDGVVFAGGGTNLNHYQATTVSVVWNAGAFTGGSAQTVTAQVRRIGTMVTVELPTVAATSNATSAEMTTSANPLSSFAPASNLYWPVVTSINGGALQIGWLSINSSGGLAVEFYPNATTTVASASSSVGYRRISVSYTM